MKIMALAALIAGIVGAQPAHAAFVDDPTRNVLPKPKESLALQERSFVIQPRTSVVLSGAVSGDDRATADLLRAELGLKAGLPAGTIELAKARDWSFLGRDLGDEGYVLETTPNGVKALATGTRGLFYAAQTLLQMAEPREIRGEKVFEVPAARVVDWPDVRDRMVLYDLRTSTVNLEYTKRWLRELARVKVNQFMLFMSGDYQYEKYPFIAGPEKLTREKLRELKAYAKSLHIELIPQVESLGHAEGVLSHDRFKDIRLGENNTYAYSPCTEATYSLLGELYDELVKELDHSPIFHVGGDEVWGFHQDPRCHERIAKGGEESLYSDHMQRLDGLLKARGRRMAIWSDMIHHYPKAAEGIDRETIVFAWDYSESGKEFKNFPLLKFFKDLGFKNIVATPAVLGFHDAYPQYPIAFRNIPGFTQAALAEGIRSVCVTVWEMSTGGNAESYLYGLTWAGHVMWSSRADDLKDFNRRFAVRWFGIRDAAEAAAHVDRLFWFPWRVTGSSVVTDADVEGFWQKPWLTGDLYYASFAQLAPRWKTDELQAMEREAHLLLRNVSESRRSLRRLDETNVANQMTLESLRMTLAVYSHTARKIAAVARLGVSYREAHAKGDRAAALRSIEEGRLALRGLRGDFPALKRAFSRAIEERNGWTQETEWLDGARVSLREYLKKLTNAREELRAGRLPAPEALDLQEPK